MTTHRRREAAAAAHHPARAAHRPGDRPGHRRAHRRTVIFWLPALARYLGGDLQTCRLGV